MSDRAYLLLDVADGKTNHVIEQLRRIAGIRIVDVLEGKPDVVAVVEAPERYRLAELTIQVISSVENMIEDLKLLPVRDGLSKKSSFESSHISKKSKGQLKYA
jgi:hypothetical protein